MPLIIKIWYVILFLAYIIWLYNRFYGATTTKISQKQSDWWCSVKVELVIDVIVQNLHKMDSILRNKKYRDRGVWAAASVYHPSLHLSLLLVHHLEVKSSWSPWSASSPSSPLTPSPPQPAPCPSSGGQFNIITIIIIINIIGSVLDGDTDLAVRKSDVTTFRCL